MNNMEIIAVIPGRANSKGIPHKTIALMNGKPLLHHAVNAVRMVESIKRVIVSTDCPKIAELANRYDIEVYERPSELATDESPIADTIRNLIDRLEEEDYRADIMLLIEATALRMPEDIHRCIDTLIKSDCDSVATFCRCSVHPSKTWRIVNDKPEPYIAGENAFKNRQDLESTWELNGGCYAFNPKKFPKQGSNFLFGKARAIVVPEYRSYDINTPLDIKIAELMINEEEHRC